MVVLDELVRDPGVGQSASAVGLREEAALVPEPVRHDQPGPRGSTGTVIEAAMHSTSSGLRPQAGGTSNSRNLPTRRDARGCQSAPEWQLVLVDGSARWPRWRGMSPKPVYRDCLHVVRRHGMFWQAVITGSASHDQAERNVGNRCGTRHGSIGLGGAEAAAWDIHSEAVRRQARGEDVILLSVGDPDFADAGADRRGSQGEPGPRPDPLCRDRRPGRAANGDRRRAPARLTGSRSSSAGRRAGRRPVRAVHRLPVPARAR